MQKHPNAFKVPKQRIKNSTEPFEGSALYPTAEPFFRFYTSKVFVGLPIKSRSTIRVWYKSEREGDNNLAA